VSRLVFATAILTLTACPRGSALPKPPPQLAPVETRHLAVTFYGTPANQTDLYVCGWYEDRFDCIEYVRFQTELQRQ
jgi:hypothetical protein